MLNEATVLEDPTYKRVRDSLITWEDGNQGTFVFVKWDKPSQCFFK